MKFNPKIVDVAFPTIDLHTHIRGTLRPCDVNALSAKNDVQVPGSSLCKHSEGHWSSFLDFLEVYKSVGAVVEKAEDWTFLVESYLLRVSAAGTAYVEFMVSPMHIVSDGLPYPAFIQALELGIDRAFRACGVRSAIIITCVRHNGPTEAEALAELAFKYPNRCVVGFGLTGDERMYSAKEFSKAFRIASCSGLMLTAHTGEWLPAESVLETVKELNLNRIGHGISVSDNQEVLAELIDMNICFETCISSNVALGASMKFKNHPFGNLYRAGAKISLCVDDPGFFKTTPRNEYKLAHNIVGGDFDKFVAKINSNAVESSFASAEVKNEIRSFAGLD